MKADNKQQNNLETQLQQERKGQPEMKASDRNSAGEDGFRYDYDDSSDLT